MPNSKTTDGLFWDSMLNSNPNSTQNFLLLLGPTFIAFSMFSLSFIIRSSRVFSLSLSLSTITEGSTLSLSHAYPHSSHYCTAYVKSIRRHVLPDPHPFRERVPRDLELVGTVHRLHHRRRHRGRQRRTRQRRRRTRIRKRGLAARKHQPQIRAFSQNPPHHDDHNLYK